MADLQELIEKLSGTKAGQTAQALISGGDTSQLGWPEDVSGAMSAAAARTRQAVMPTGGRQQGFMSAIVPGMASGLLSLPERAMHAAGDLQRTGDVYDPAPAVGAALATMGRPFPRVTAAPETLSAETISGAATRYGGKVYQGAHHGEAVELAAKDTGKTIDEIADATLAADDGFVTSTGRFVSRQEAMGIAKSAGQLGLFSRIMQPVKRLTLGEYGAGNPLMSEELKKP